MGKYGRILGSALVAASGLSASVADAAQPGTWRLGSGVNYSSGDYGLGRSTRVISAPVSLGYRKGRLSLKLVLPYVDVNGPASLADTPQGRDAGFGGAGSGGDGNSSGSGNSGVEGDIDLNDDNDNNDGSGDGDGGTGGDPGGGGGVPVPPPVVVPINDHRSGFGDLSALAGYALPLGEGTSLDLSARVKLPTASTAKRLGTGKADYTLGAEIGQQVGPVRLSLGGRRRFVGRDSGSTLRDVWGISGGASFRVAKSAAAGLSYDWQQSYRPDGGASSEVGGWVGLTVVRNLRLQVYGSKGLNDRSADFATGLSVSLRVR